MVSHYAKLLGLSLGRPHLALDRGVTDFMARQEGVHRPRYAFVQENSHAEVGVNNADSDRSSTRTTIGRVTDGKHSRNSSSV